MGGGPRGRGPLLFHGKTDLLLLDPEPVEHKDWITANELLEQGKQAKLFLVEDALNLYDIFVRKQDVVSKSRRDRIMAHMPYVVLDAAQVAFIRTHLNGVVRQVITYFKGSMQRDLCGTQARIQTFLRQL